MQQFDRERGTCVALGNFDGIHLGHRAIISGCALAGKKSRRVSLVWSFRRHPEHILKNNFSSGNIISVEDKEIILKEMGIDRLILADFERVRDLSPEQFCRQILVGQLCAKEVFCGFNFRFGKGGEGDAQFLRECLEKMGVTVTVFDPVCLEGDVVSSTRIRTLLSQGEMEAAGALLGRPYFIRFPVLHGKHLGTKIGFPTVNQAFPEEYVIPKKGVYAVRMNFEGQHYPGVCNIGSRPTVDQDNVILAETNLFDFSGDLYGKEVQVEFFHFIRPEQKFSSLEELIRQIAKDRESARLWWKENL